jgi:hypothetical protein
VLQLAVDQPNERIGHNCFFVNGDIKDANTFDPFTHVYMFNTGFNPREIYEIAQKFNNSRSHYLICYLNEQSVAEYGFVVEPLCSVGTSMCGSNRKHTAFIYTRQCKTTTTVNACESCDPMFEVPLNQVQQGLRHRYEQVVKEYNDYYFPDLKGYHVSRRFGQVRQATSAAPLAPNYICITNHATSDKNKLDDVCVSVSQTSTHHGEGGDKNSTQSSADIISQKEGENDETIYNNKGGVNGSTGHLTGSMTISSGPYFTQPLVSVRSPAVLVAPTLVQTRNVATLTSKTNIAAVASETIHITDPSIIRCNICSLSPAADELYCNVIIHGQCVPLHIKCALYPPIDKEHLGLVSWRSCRTRYGRTTANELFKNLNTYTPVSANLNTSTPVSATCSSAASNSLFCMKNDILSFMAKNKAAL